MLIGGMLIMTVGGVRIGGVLIGGVLIDGMLMMRVGGEGFVGG